VRSARPLSAKKGRRRREEGVGGGAYIKQIKGKKRKGFIRIFCFTCRVTGNRTAQKKERPKEDLTEDEKTDPDLPSTRNNTKNQIRELPEWR